MLRGSLTHLFDGSGPDSDPDRLVSWVTYTIPGQVDSWVTYPREADRSHEFQPLGPPTEAAGSGRLEVYPVKLSPSFDFLATTPVPPKTRWPKVAVGCDPR